MLLYLFAVCEKQVEQRRFIVSVIKVGKTLELNHKKPFGITENTFVQADLFEEDRIKKNC